MYAIIRHTKGVVFMGFMTREQLAEHFGVHYNTVRNWIDRGAPCYKNGCFVRFKLDEIEKWLKKGD